VERRKITFIELSRSNRYQPVPRERVSRVEKRARNEDVIENENPSTRQAHKLFIGGEEISNGNRIAAQNNITIRFSFSLMEIKFIRLYL
jgi:hypothetical protein